MAASRHDHLTDQLFKVILSLKDQEQCYRFFDDLCTVSEVKAMAQRPLNIFIAFQLLVIFKAWALRMGPSALFCGVNCGHTECESVQTGSTQRGIFHKTEHGVALRHSGD